MTSIRGLMTFFAVLSSQVCAAAPAEQPLFVRQCVFNSIVAFGASITNEMPYNGGILYKGLVNATERMVDSQNGQFGPANSGEAELYNPNPAPVTQSGIYQIGEDDKIHLRRDWKSPLRKYAERPYGRSPIHYLIDAVGNKWAHKHISFLSKNFGTDDSDNGSAQILSLIDGDKRKVFESASLIIGVDAFYWDATGNNCGYGNGGGVEPIIQNFIEETHARGQTLILGNVPLENTENVRLFGGGGWYPTYPRCVQSINDTLKQYCTTDKGCYIVDLYSMAADLNCGKKLVMDDGSAFSLYEMRPDGVHLSDKASLYVSEQIVKSFRIKTPTCRN